ncbi:hypothetical protein [Thiohalophilus sp.]|uniref:hypothetical protein n=1 Tax=Thiohalophilus sp. TaxID=3028392 RepID=UPI002ACD4538|nr:hypothetical protein [Thiohalophilus sp.]MDZ7805355.1 hypothetical protein [Thiohalophilus sp.]
MKTEQNTRANKLTVDEKAELKFQVSATPAQRLAWLEEAQQLALKSGALKCNSRGQNKKIKPFALPERD